MIAIRADAERVGIGDIESSPGGLSRPTSAQQVADHIRRMIFDNRLPAGSRVPQDEIAAELRVSRVPVREAVIALDREGWVITEPHRGAFVNGLDENSTYDHYELLGLLFGFGARRAAERGSPEGMAALAGTHKKLQATSDPDEFWDHNSAFQRQMLMMAQSRRINAIARVMATSIVPGNFFAEVPGVIRIHKRGMRAVMRAMKAGDGATAEKEFAATLRAEAENVVALLASRNLLGPTAAGPRGPQPTDG